MFLLNLEGLILILSILLIFVSLLIFISNNPVHSVLFLILAFFNVSIQLFILNVEFLSIIFIIIYVGAIAVLFLFVVMMLNIKKFAFKFRVYYLIFFIVAMTLYDKSSEKLVAFFIQVEKEIVFMRLPLFLIDELNNLNVLGQILFNYYNSCFLLAGFILLIAMIGAIVLSLSFRTTSKNQLLYRQLSRSEKYFYFF